MTLPGSTEKADCISGANGCGDLGRRLCSRGWCGYLSSPTRDAAPASPASLESYAGHSQAYHTFFTACTKCNLRFASFCAAQNDFQTASLILYFIRIIHGEPLRFSELYRIPYKPSTWLSPPPDHSATFAADT